MYKKIVVNHYHVKRYTMTSTTTTHHSTTRHGGLTACMLFYHYFLHFALTIFGQWPVHVPKPKRLTHTLQIDEKTKTVPSTCTASTHTHTMYKKIIVNHYHINHTYFWPMACSCVKAQKEDENQTHWPVCFDGQIVTGIMQNQRLRFGKWADYRYKRRDSCQESTILLISKSSSLW